MDIEKKSPSWLEKTDIESLCSNINGKLYADKELQIEFKWNQYYMNLDLIIHSENIYEYFINLDNGVFEKNAPIYIYGLFQSFFTQQDAIVQLEKLFSKKLSFGLVCDKYFEFKETEKEINPIKVIRWHRNNKIGHPTTRNVDKISEFEKKLNKKYFPNSKHNTDNNEKKMGKSDQKLFFLAYGSNHKKTCIKYATYDSEFIEINVNLVDAIKNQRIFTKNFLNNLDEKIENVKK